jgi:hypothetical protein
MKKQKPALFPLMGNSAGFFGGLEENWLRQIT